MLADRAVGDVQFLRRPGHRQVARGDLEGAQGVQWRQPAGRCLPGVFLTEFHTDKLACPHRIVQRSEEHTSELQSLMRISYAVFCLKKKTKTYKSNTHNEN